MSPQTHITSLSVRKGALATSRLRTLEAPELPDGQIRVRIDRFALTANNITYAAFGEAMNYWQFFPVIDASGAPEPEWGHIPVWGFGTVQASRHPDLAVGERLYGYFPMATAVDLVPAKVSASSLMDAAAHRAALHPVYNQYLRCANDPFHAAGTEDLQALLRPLFITSWLIDDFLADNNYFGAASDPGRRPAMLLSSASSKTAYGTAFQMAQRKDIEVIGLTSPGNVAFCESLGCYQRVLSYEQLDAIAADTPCIYVDFAGNAALRKDVHSRFTALAYSCSIGGTHVSALGTGRDLPGPRPVLFFAPAQIKKRSAEWGGEVLNAKLVDAWQQFSRRVADKDKPWLLVQHHLGPRACEDAYAQVLKGRSDPRTGHILSLYETLS